MSVEPELQEFVFENRRVMDVASRLSVSRPTVKKALQTYIVFRQLAEFDEAVEDEHYSLIEAAVGLCGYMYFTQDQTTFRFTDASVAKLAELCQFAKRRQGRGSGTLIIPEPKTFGALGRILKHSQEHDNEAIRTRALDLLRAIERAETNEQTGELVMTVDKALSLLTSEINRKEWVASVNAQLDKAAELDVADFDGEGNHQLYKEELEKSLTHVRTIFGI
jgi:hypothetical protein